MKILISTSKVKEQNLSAKVKVESGKPTKTKPAIAKILVSTADKKNAASITLKPTKDATIEKPKYDAKVTGMGKGRLLKNAAECIAVLKTFGFDPKDAKPIRDFFSGKTTAAQFKKAMGTKSYTTKEDDKAVNVIKLINATKLPTSGKGKVTRKMVDDIFADYQRFPVLREVEVKKLLKAIEAHNAGTLKPAALQKVRLLFGKEKPRNAKVSAMSKKFHAAIALMESPFVTPNTSSNNSAVKSNTTGGRFSNIQSSKVSMFADDLLSEGKITERQATTLNNLFGKVIAGSATIETFDKIKGMLRKPEGSHPRLLGQVVGEIDTLQKKSGVADKVKTRNLKLRAKLVPQRFSGKARVVVGMFDGSNLVTGISARPSGRDVPSYFNVVSFGEMFGSTKVRVINTLRKMDGFKKVHEELFTKYALGDLSAPKFIKAFNSGTSVAGASELDPKLNFTDREWGKIKSSIQGRWRSSPRKVAQILKLFYELEAGKLTKSKASRLVRDWKGGTLKTEDPKVMAGALREIPSSVRKHLVNLIDDSKSTSTKSKSSSRGTKTTDAKTPTAKAEGNVITDGELSFELPENSQLTAGEATKIMGYFSSLIEAGEVAKAQCTRALKDLASGTMTGQMKKRWLARVGSSSIRPVPRKLVTILREAPTN